MYEFPNQQTEKSYPDGTTEIQFADGIMKTIHPSGDEYSKFPDGTTMLETKDGLREVTLLNSKKVRYYPDGKMTQYGCLRCDRQKPRQSHAGLAKEGERAECWQAGEAFERTGTVLPAQGESRGTRARECNGTGPTVPVRGGALIALASDDGARDSRWILLYVCRGVLGSRDMRGQLLYERRASRCQQIAARSRGEFRNEPYGRCW